MHICHVITRLIIGGAQENTVLSCEGLHELGHRVTLISGPTTGPEGALLARVRAGGYAFIEVPELVRAIRPLSDWRCRQKLIDVYRTIRPDIVHTHSSKAGILGREAARAARVPHIVHTVHGMSFNRTQPWPVRELYRRLEKHCAKFSDAIVAVADAMCDQMFAAGVCERDKLSTIYSGMEVEHFDPARHDRAATRAAWGVGDEHIVIGAVARLFRRKGYEQLIPIMHTLAAVEPRLRFVWVGDGAQRSEYEQRLGELGLRDKTTLVGLVPPAEVARQLAGMDIVAHTSQWEGLPRVVVQALLMRVPVVAFDIDGTPEVVRDGETGRLIGLNQLAAFGDAILALANSPETRARMGAAGRELCLARFDRRVMTQALDELYRRLMANRSTVQ